MNVLFRSAAMSVCLPLLLLSGCGMPAAPAPPSLKLPQPPTDLAAYRTGNEVHLSWTMPKRTTDKVPLKGMQQARVCRHLDAGPCQPAGVEAYLPEKPATFVDQLPANITSGSPRPLSYTVELLNHAGKTAGPSNTVQLAAGASLPKVENLVATARPNGVLLKWSPVADADGLIRIHRTLKQAPPSKDAKTPPKPPEPDTLEVDDGGRAETIDRSAALDNTYTYVVSRVKKVRITSGDSEIVGPASDPYTVNAKDIFPPNTPDGLQAVADPDAKAIDLSWAPDSENDLAGYLVYRRELGGSGQAERISGAKPEMAPSFRDLHVEAGRRYAYSVSAVDKDGNESKRSEEAEEALP
jgi:hypothetical protein